MDSIVIVIGLTLLIGLSLGFWLGLLVTTLLAGPDVAEASECPSVYGHAVGAWWR